MSKKEIMKKWKKNGGKINIYIILMIIIAVAYLICQHFCDWERLTETVATIIAIISAVAFWLEYRDNKLLNEAQFIMELNEQFIGDGNLSNIERELEKYYILYRKDELTEEYKKEFEEKFDSKNPDRQYLINYLVHLECIAALVNNGVIRLNKIYQYENGLQKKNELKNKEKLYLAGFGEEDGE